jgi:hypothetical protein
MTKCRWKIRRELEKEENMKKKGEKRTKMWKTCDNRAFYMPVLFTMLAYYGACYVR